MNKRIDLLPRPGSGDGAGVGSHAHRIEVAAVNSALNRSLYKKREAIHPKLARGKYRSLKWWMMGVLLAIYYITPWIRWDRGPGRADQAVLVDFEGRRFYFFALELWPQEIYFFTGLLILAAIGLFLTNALFGRVWCGYACPQTVWTDLFIHIERLTEGDRNARLRLARAPFSFNKAARKTAKHALWLLVAAATGGAWVFWFGDAPTLFRDIFTGKASTTVWLMIGLLVFTTYTLAGTLREQVCTYMCPWPRIQAAMTDKDALSVTYRRDRGEPRAAHKKGETWQGRGDCVDCNQCVAVCPQGIDIRDGDQLECINCALCIDACDDVMRKVGRPTGLIAYDSWANAQRRVENETPRMRFLRPRTVLYAAVMTVVGGVMLLALLSRKPVTLDIVRDRSPAFVRMVDGSVRNNYQIKVLNKGAFERSLEIRIEDAPGASLSAFGDGPRRAGMPRDRVEVRARADTVTLSRINVTVPAGGARGPGIIRFAVHDPVTGNVLARHDAAFVGG